MNKLNDPKISLSFAVSHFGTKAALAGVLGLNRTTVTDWVNKDNFAYVPALYAYRLIRNYPGIFKETA